ncbi:MAG: hypothetical protein QXH80_00520 [Candidatus Nanoarchaeia archaeon]
MAKKILLGILVLLCFGFLATSVSAAYQSASILRTDTNATQDVYFSTAGNGYKDDVGNTPDVKVRVCADTADEVNSSKKVAVFYLIATNSSGLLKYDILGGDTQARFISLGTPFSSGGYNCSEADFEFFAGRSPYPANVFAVVDVNGNNTGETFDYGLDEIIAITDANGYLKGSFTTNNVQSSYNQGTGNVNIDVTAVTVYTASGTSQALPSGLEGENKLLVGVCADSQGVDCTSTARTNMTASSVSLATGITSPADSTNYTRYAVVNGIGASFCIGPDLRVSGVTVVPSSTTAGQSVNITATIVNNNNVDVTTNFDVEFLRDGNSIANVTVTEDLSPSESTTASYIYDTTGLTSGNKNIVARVLDANAGIADCNNGNDNSSTTLNIGKAYYVQVLINGTVSTNFPVPGRPYNVSLHVNDSDGNNVAALVKITEKNGINLFAPVQGWGASDGVSPLAVATFETNAGGDANIALMPTGNKLYNPEYAYLNVSDYVGNYSLYLEIFNITTGTELQLSDGVNLLDQIDFTLGNMSVELPTAGQENTIFVYNHNIFVQQIVDLANQVYSSMKKWTGVI